MSKKKNCNEKIQSKVEIMQNDDSKNWEQGMGSNINGFSFVFFCKKKRVVWMHCGDGDATTRMYLMLLDCTLESGYAGNIYVASA